MQKITKLMRDAFMSNTNFKSDNTEVRVTIESTSIYLFGNRIAYRNNDENMYITTCGWNTRTTKERLNALPNVHITQLKGMWYLNGEKWNGESTSVYA
jgi:hypothetical protein